MGWRGMGWDGMGLRNLLKSLLLVPWWQFVCYLRPQQNLESCSTILYLCSAGHKTCDHRTVMNHPFTPEFPQHLTWSFTVHISHHNIPINHLSYTYLPYTQHISHLPPVTLCFESFHEKDLKTKIVDYTYLTCLPYVLPSCRCQPYDRITGSPCEYSKFRISKLQITGTPC